jgi:MFS family permease
MTRHDEGTSMPAAHRKVIVASSLGAMFEWYDFYLYGVLAPVFALHFFAVPAATQRARGHAAGLCRRLSGAPGRRAALRPARRPDRAQVHLPAHAGADGRGHLCDRPLAGIETIGIAAPIALVVLSVLQGLAIGGEYGGVATYVAEHAPPGRRGLYTGWIQTTASLGLLLALLVIVGLRSLLARTRLRPWGWRLPFLLSFVLLALWCVGAPEPAGIAALPAPQAIGGFFASAADRGVLTLAQPAPGADRAVRTGRGQAVVWYNGQFQALFFLTLQLKVDTTRASLMMCVALALAAPLFVSSVRCPTASAASRSS